MTTPPARCARCGLPAVAVVTRSTARISIRTDRLTDPRTSTAWAADLHCWSCTTALVDQHITATTQLPA